MAKSVKSQGSQLAVRGNGASANGGAELRGRLQSAGITDPTDLEAAVEMIAGGEVEADVIAEFAPDPEQQSVDQAGAAGSLATAAAAQPGAVAATRELAESVDVQAAEMPQQDDSSALDLPAIADKGFNDGAAAATRAGDTYLRAYNEGATQGMGAAAQVINQSVAQTEKNMNAFFLGA